MSDETETAKVNGEEPTLPREWDPVLKLSKPVHANGQEVTELKFREPKGRDIEEVGMPVLPNFRFDVEAMGMMMARLANVPPSTIKALPSKDWTTGAYKIWDFFLPGPR